MSQASSDEQIPKDSTLREITTCAIQYWEPQRVVYNAVLAIVVLVYMALGAPLSLSSISLNGVLFVFALAVLANVCYCAAYVVDIFVQSTAFRQRWMKSRIVLFVIGTAFAAIITRAFAIAMFFRAND